MQNLKNCNCCKHDTNWIRWEIFTALLNKYFILFIQNPSHSCCKFEEPPKNDIEEDAKKDNIVEEVTNKPVEIVVETTQNINEVEVSTISLESNIESLKTLPELTIEEKGTNKAPVIRNDIVKQRLEGKNAYSKWMFHVMLKHFKT